MSSTSISKDDSVSPESSESGQLISTGCPITSQSITDETRINVWLSCLNVLQKSEFSQRIDAEEMDNVDYLPDIVHYASITADSIGISEFEKASFRWEIIRILSYYSVKKEKKFDPTLGWHNLLEPIMLLQTSEAIKYKLFETILHYYIPRTEDHIAILRLLLIYHDPQLYFHLDSRGTTLRHYPSFWINRLFSGCCTIPVIFAIWDRYFIEKDRFLIYFLAAALMINSRDKILSVGQVDDKKKIISAVWTLPCDLTVEDIPDLYNSANDLKVKTPTSYLETLRPIIFGEKYNEDTILDAAYWPVMVKELMKTTAKSSVLSAVSRNVKFFIVDCRSTDEYNAGHLPIAYPIDYSLKVTNPIKFIDSIEQLMDLQRNIMKMDSESTSSSRSSSSAVKHFCFLDSGRTEDAQYTKMIINSCLRRNLKYVSIIFGGYQALHLYAGDKIDNYLVNHNINRCLVCNGNKKKSGGLMQELEKLKKGGEAFVNRLKSSKSTYFMDETPGPSTMVRSQSMYEDLKIESITKWFKDPTLMQYFKCQELDNKGKYQNCYLLITKEYLIALREISDRVDAAYISVKRALSSVAQIITKRNNKNLIIFTYDKTDKVQDLVTNDKSTFLFPENPSALIQYISDKILEKIKFAT